LIFFVALRIFTCRARRANGCLGGFRALRSSCGAAGPAGGLPPAGILSKMQKLKTKSGAKKRFKITATGKVLYAQRGKRHGMIKRTNKQIRNLRGTSVMFKSDGDNIIKYFLPNG
jgi:large subunit ribosomal protein L35